MLAQMVHLDKGYHDNLIYFHLPDCFDHKVVNKLASSRRPVSLGAARKMVHQASLLFYFAPPFFSRCAPTNWTPGRGYKWTNKAVYLVLGSAKPTMNSVMYLAVTELAFAFRAEFSF